LLFLDLGHQPGFSADGSALTLRIVMGESTGLENHRTQLGDTAATSVIEIHKRKTGPGHRILQEPDRRCRRQAMLAA